MWKKWKFWDKYYKKSMLRAFAGRELKNIDNFQYMRVMGPKSISDHGWAINVLAIVGP